MSNISTWVRRLAELLFGYLILASQWLVAHQSSGLSRAIVHVTCHHHASYELVGHSIHCRKRSWWLRLTSWKGLGWLAFDVNVGEAFTEFTTIGQSGVPSASQFLNIISQRMLPHKGPTNIRFVPTNRGKQDCCDASYMTQRESQTGDQKMLMLNSPR